MSKFYKSTNYIATIKQDGIINCMEFNTYKDAVNWVRELYNEEIDWKIHRIAQTFKTLPIFSKDKEQTRERVDKKYSIEEVHSLFKQWEEEYGSMYSRQKKRIKVDLDGYLVKTYSQRYEVFKNNTKCVVCGLEGTHYRLERQVGSNQYHFNLYGMRNGEEILFTKDHILPKSKGGANSLSNYQTMCYDCNQEKADNYKEEV